MSTGHITSVTYLIGFEGKVISGSDDNTIKVWDLKEEGKCLQTLRGHTNSVDCLLKFDGNLISGSWDKTIKVWEHPTHFFGDEISKEEGLKRKTRE